MSLLDTASLVITPNGTKAGTLYSVVPSSGAGDMTVTRATTATRVNSAGLIESVASNVPRLDYSNGTCPSILVEPQRTNLFLRSQEFENASWVKQNTILNANSIISPDGTQNAEKFIASNTSSLHAMFNLTATLSGLYTISIYAKKGEYDYIVLHEQFSGTFFGHFNLNTGVVMSGTGAKIESVGNGWYRCMVSFNALGVFNIPSFSPSNAFGDINYTGDGTSGIYIWGAQLEAGSYATSYIPTTSASVTRNADVISKTGISSLIGQTSGTVFLDINIDSSFAQDDMRFLDISDGSSANWYFIGTNNTNEFRFYFKAGGSVISTLTPFTSGRNKMAFAYANNDYVIYINGVQIYSTTTATVGSTSELNLGKGFSGSSFKQFTNSVALWKTRLTNTQLAQLTTI